LRITFLHTIIKEGKRKRVTSKKKRTSGKKKTEGGGLLKGVSAESAGQGCRRNGGVSDIMLQGIVRNGVVFWRGRRNF